MSTTNVAAILSALGQEYEEKLRKQSNRRAPLASLIGTVPGHSHNIAFDVQMDGATAESYAEGADVSTFTNDVEVPATLAYGHYKSAFHITETALDVASTSPAAARELRDLLDLRIMGAGEAVCELVEADMWSGDGTDGSGNPTIVGFDGGAIAATGIYANINRATYPLWAGNTLANGGVLRALTEDLLAQADENIFTATGQKADFIMAHPSVHRKYASFFYSGARINAGMNGNLTYNAGSDTLLWKGVPIQRAVSAPAGCLLMGVKDHAKKVVLASSKDSSADVSKAGSVAAQGSNGEGQHDRQADDREGRRGRRQERQGQVRARRRAQRPARPARAGALSSSIRLGTYTPFPVRSAERGDHHEDGRRVALGCGLRVCARVQCQGGVPRGAEDGDAQHREGHAVGGGEVPHRER